MSQVVCKNTKFGHPKLLDVTLYIVSYCVGGSAAPSSVMFTEEGKHHHNGGGNVSWLYVYNWIPDW